MKRKYTYLVLLISGILSIMVSCEPEIADFKPNQGEADFSIFVALGGSETAGFTDNELYRSAQIVSFPNIISRQLLHVGGSEFKQPLMPDELGFGNKLVLSLIADCIQDSTIWAVPATGVPDEENMMNIFEEEGAFHNLGIPFAGINDLVAPLHTTQGYFHQYFSRFASAPNASPLSDAVALQPTFFSLWTGNADLLDYATDLNSQLSIIEPEEFTQTLIILLQQLTVSSSGGVIGNIPDILQFPYFTHIPAQGLWVEDSLSENGIRLLEANELVLLPAALSIRCNQMGGPQNPIPQHLFLPNSRIVFIQSRINAFNAIIEEKAAEYNLAVADINTLMKQITAGLVIEGIQLSNEYLTGEMFSLDGLSLSRRGNAVVANWFIDAINTAYNSTIPRVSISQFQSIEYP